MSAAWHVVHTQANGERRAATNLARQGFGPYLPMFRRRIRHARQTMMAARPLFPRYLFVRFDPAAARWRSINGTLGVVRLLCDDARPLAVPPGVVEAIRARHDADGFVRVDAARHFARGQPVEITQGALALATGSFERLTGAERVVLLLDLLGRPVRVSVPVGAVAAA